MGRGKGKWKTGQQLCRKVCNSIKGSCKCPVYKAFRDWFHGLLGHETRGEKKGNFMVQGSGKGREGRGKGGDSGWVSGLVGRATGKKYNL